MSAPQSTEKVELLTCNYCQAPVVKSVGSCQNCTTPITGKEPRYIVRGESRPEVQPLFVWWAIWSLVIWVFSGFSLGKVSSILLTVVAAWYLFKILRTYYSD